MSAEVHHFVGNFVVTISFIYLFLSIKVMTNIINTWKMLDSIQAIVYFNKMLWHIYIDVSMRSEIVIVKKEKVWERSMRETDCQRDSFRFLVCCTLGYALQTNQWSVAIWEISSPHYFWKIEFWKAIASGLILLHSPLDLLYIS